MGTKRAKEKLPQGYIEIEAEEVDDDYIEKVEKDVSLENNDYDENKIDENKIDEKTIMYKSYLNKRLNILSIKVWNGNRNIFI